MILEYKGSRACALMFTVTPLTYVAEEKLMLPGLDVNYQELNDNVLGLTIVH